MSYQKLNHQFKNIDDMKEMTYLLHSITIIATYPQAGVVVRVLHHLAED